ncbi:unnamed protein product [Phaeothamnion confervicola]
MRRRELATREFVLPCTCGVVDEPFGLPCCSGNCAPSGCSSAFWRSHWRSQRENLQFLSSTHVEHFTQAASNLPNLLPISVTNCATARRLLSVSKRTSVPLLLLQRNALNPIAFARSRRWSTSGDYATMLFGGEPSAEEKISSMHATDVGEKA